MNNKIEEQIKILEYCKEQGIPIKEPIQDGENWIYTLDLADITEAQYEYLKQFFYEEK